MNRLRPLFALLTLNVLVLAPQAAFSNQQTGWFFGGSFSLLELGATGKIVTPNGDLDFDVQEPYAPGLVDNRIISTNSDIGLGWENNQLLGGKFSFGYRSGFRWATHVDIFWALPKVEELPGYPGDNPGADYLSNQSTRWTYKSTRLMFDWRPFEPLPMWYFTFGAEYVVFSSRLEFNWQNDSFDQILRYYESYEDGGNAIGAVIGTGLFFTSQETPRQEWFINMTYSYTPFNDPYFAWEGDFLVGGVTLEGGARFFVSGGK